MKNVKRTALALLILLFVGAAHAASLPEELRSRWNDLSEILVKASSLRDKLPSLPDSAYFADDKQGTNKKITKLLREAQEILLSSDSLKLLRRTEQIRERMPELYAIIEEYKEKRIAAPIKSYNPFVHTVKDCDEKIADAEKDIARLNKELEEIRAAVTAELRASGLKLTDAQADVLFSSVVGDDLLKNTIIFENVKGVTEQLSALLAQNKDDIGVARRYYGMYVTLIDILLDCQERFALEIDEKWIPQVTVIASNASKSLSEARQALTRKDFTPAQKSIFKSNAASNEMIVAAADKYRQLLTLQKKSILKCAANIKRDREVAVNTYATVRHISDMSSVIKSGIQLFDALSAMQLPEIQAFESAGVRREFDEITRRLQLHNQ
ncbi:MAG: hypothetical protein SOZ52_04935 [Pyramidobacter sp.]|nr:hypothetical protein [Pyramidobacter sp.]